MENMYFMNYEIFFKPTKNLKTEYEQCKNIFKSGKSPIPKHCQKYLKEWKNDNNPPLQKSH